MGGLPDISTDLDMWICTFSFYSTANAHLCKSLILHVQRQWRKIVDHFWCGATSFVRFVSRLKSFYSGYPLILNKCVLSKSYETCILHLEAVRYLFIKSISNYKCWFPRSHVGWDHNLLCKSRYFTICWKITLIAECKDNGYLYIEETPINKLLKCNTVYC